MLAVRGSSKEIQKNLLEEKEPSIFITIDSIEKISEILELKLLAKEQTCVFIDFDLTVADIKPEIMSDRNASARRAFIQEFKELKREDVVNLAYEKQKNVLLEGTKTLDAVKKLQKNYTAFIFTARRTGKPSVTSKETTQDIFAKTLSSLGLNFSASLSEKNIPLIIKNNEQLENPNLFPYGEPGFAMYDRGTIFSNNLKKGEVLKAFYEHMQKHGKEITNIIFIDDSDKNLKSVQDACVEIGNKIRFIGVHYTAALAKKSSLDKNIIAIQKKYLLENKEFKSDDEAELILKRSKEELFNTISIDSNKDAMSIYKP